MVSTWPWSRWRPGHPVPVRLTVTIAERPPPAVEVAAYYVVSEALANIGKHAQATAAQVCVERQDSRLVVDVRDNGRGGAQAHTGSGLDRLRSAGGGAGRSALPVRPADGGESGACGAPVSLRVSIAEDSVLLREASPGSSPSPAWT